MIGALSADFIARIIHNINFFHGNVLFVCDLQENIHLQINLKKKAASKQLTSVPLVPRLHRTKCIHPGTHPSALADGCVGVSGSRWSENPPKIFLYDSFQKRWYLGGSRAGEGPVGGGLRAEMNNIMKSPLLPRFLLWLSLFFLGWLGSMATARRQIPWIGRFNNIMTHRWFRQGM